MYALLITYRLDGTSPAEQAELSEELAPAFAAVRGLVALTWLANQATGRYGGFYVFEDRVAFDAFVASELFGLLHSQPSVAEIAISDYAVSATLPAFTRGGPGTVAVA